MTVVVRGNFGDTRVEPAVLFDVSDLDGPGPPADALDVQYRAPLSFSLLVGALLAEGRELDAQTCYKVYERVIDYTMERLQLSCGYVREEQYGDQLPARLELVALGESDVPGIDTVRMHHHIWIGPTAVTLEDGVRRPVDRERMRRGLQNVVWPSFVRKLMYLSAEVLGVEWGRPRPGAFEQIIDPPMHEHTAGHELGVCPSPWGPREVWEQPTPELLAWEAAQVADFADREARGVAWKPAGRVLDY